ncbi:fructose 1,6-bisphosphate aldolase/phosphatase [Desulforamulus putei DSM 12395]|uniref:Fructose-1,6-bisphosphate aldolase/phosphatase n=1 Tax=Desulforamulus putei DSM 12395 TaxID=1121429 RepID=A0A1M5D6E7_9FIRM|nr:fructose-1,6-bisphosphate aldolase/phosphatase [Desulforamulus putei]SHF62556.1 fructose 1,6-bisphosphate aldolase/phosphatase [Desulforamulus putei DSM 12395]
MRHRPPNINRWKGENKIEKKITLSVIKADVGGFVGHSGVHPELVKKACEELDASPLLIDHHVTYVGDDINLILTHELGCNNEDIRRLARNILSACTEVAKKLKLCGAGQDLLSDAFAGNIKGLGPGVAEMEIEERKSETVIILMADKTGAGAWNLPLYKIFADPFNTTGLIIDPNMHCGFNFEVYDLVEKKKINFAAPEEIYDMLVFIGAPGRFVIKHVYHRGTGEIAAVSSAQPLYRVAGRYVGKDDPVCIVRCQTGYPSLGEVLEAFSHPHLVAGWLRGSHIGPLLPVEVKDAHPVRFDGPPRVIALGFQLAGGKLVGPQDMFADPAFDNARQVALDIADYMRRMGPFEPHRLHLDEMEYTTMPQVMRKLKDRFIDLPEDRETGT